MGKDSKIEWTDHTFNAWWGCTKVSDGCKHCYAEAMANRWGDWFGPGKERRTFGDKHWAEPLKWNKSAAKAGKRQRVFCSSMADVFEDGAPDDERLKLWDLIAETPNLEWLLLTKRPENWPLMLPETAPNKFTNIRLGVTIEHMAAMNARGPIVDWAGAMGWPTFVSYEPALGAIDWGLLLSPGNVHWVVAGGESGPSARQPNPDWLRLCRDACARLGVPFLFKQWGGRDKKAAGRLLDGREHLEFPALTSPTKGAA